MFRNIKILNEFPVKRGGCSLFVRWSIYKPYDNKAWDNCQKSSDLIKRHWIYSWEVCGEPFEYACMLWQLHSIFEVFILEAWSQVLVPVYFEQYLLKYEMEKKNQQGEKTLTKF